jgi:putative CocE/NonD family hydrolase
VPALVCVGWWDERTTVPTWVALGESKGAEEVLLLVGAWDHAGNNAVRPVLGGLDVSTGMIDIFREVERFLARHLKPEEGTPAASRCRVFDAGRMAWDNLPDWPDPDARPYALYLRSGGGAQSSDGDGRLTADLPAAAEPADTVEFDPARPEPSMYNLDLFAWSDPPLDHRYLHRRPSLLVYTSEPLEEPLLVSGEVVVEFFASSDRPDSDLVVELSDVHPDGRAIAFNSGARRLRFQDDGTEELLEPDEIRRVRIPVCWLHHTFQPGHAVRVAIGCTNFPFTARNLNTGAYWADEAAPLVARNTVHHDAESPSRLLLPVVPSGAEA